MQAVLKKIHELIGVRAICYYVDDIYRIEKKLKEQSDFRIVKVKDYIQNPKISGYQSLHVILKVPIVFQKEIQWIDARIAASDSSDGFLGKLGSVSCVIRRKVKSCSP